MGRPKKNTTVPPANTDNTVPPLQTPSEINNGEAAVFGDVGAPTETVGAGTVGDVIIDTPPASVSEPVPPLTPAVEPDAPVEPVQVPVSPAQADTVVFGPGATEGINRATQSEPTVTIPASALAQMQAQLNELSARVLGDDTIDLLKPTNQKSIINATFYPAEDGTQYLVLGYIEKVFPNGSKGLVYNDGFDKKDNPIQKAVLRVVDTETGALKNIEVLYERFINFCTAYQTQVDSVQEVLVDLTPREEKVELMTYAENGRYISRVGTETYVRTSVNGKVRKFTVSVNGKSYTLDSDVVNLKQ